MLQTKWLDMSGEGKSSEIMQRYALVARVYPQWEKVTIILQSTIIAFMTLNLHKVLKTEAKTCKLFYDILLCHVLLTNLAILAIIFR